MEFCYIFCRKGFVPVIIVIQQWKYILYCYMAQSLRITRWCISDSSVSSLAYCNYLGIRYITDEEVFTLSLLQSIR